MCLELNKGGIVSSIHKETFELFEINLTIFIANVCFKSLVFIFSRIFFPKLNIDAIFWHVSTLYVVVCTFYGKNLIWIKFILLGDTFADFKKISSHVIVSRFIFL